MPKFSLALYITMLAAISATDACAADRDVKVKFKPGTTTATFASTIKGYDVVNYYLDAKAGQTVQVHFTKSRNTCYNNIIAPSGKELIPVDSTTSRDYSASMTENGRYRAVVYMMRVSARRGLSCKYSITFEIKD